jgi:hypothetical protein
MKFRQFFIQALAASLALGGAASAQEAFSRPDDHAPIGVMGDHFHEAGEYMFTYRYMNMGMRDNAIGSSDIAPASIATTIPNRFFGQPMQPPTLRVVPLAMTMEMHMLGLMYAPSDRITLMAMTQYLGKEMDHVTYMGPAGTTVLGAFRTKTRGLGDTSVSALIRIHEDDNSRFHVNFGVSIPTGATDETGTVLAPTGMQPTLRFPYPMQLGSGSYDLLPALTWARFLSAEASAGVQWRGVIRTSDNDEGYTLGDEHRLTGWYSRLLSPHLSWSARLEWLDRGNVDGIDPRIVAPVQTADPARQGVRRLDLGLGLNASFVGGHRLALEYLVPIDQDLDGPKLKTDDRLTFGYQLSF